MATEVQERLAQSLYNAVRLIVGIEQQDYRVQRPWSATVVQQSQSGVPLDDGTRIVEVFDRPEIKRQLLILGEPGAGKTTMMLELAEDLLQRATVNQAEPIPVLLSLSSWKDPKQSIFEWLVGELKGKYRIRKNLAQQWLTKNQLLPLLDGLDEVAPQHQQACAVALNTWLTGELDQRPCGVLICCRREEFEQVVRQPLSLYGAIYLQALTVEQIEDYFAQFKLQDVWQAVQQDRALQQLLTTPLFLSMFGLVQTQGKFSFSDWQSHTTSKRKIEYLLDTYWDATITRELIIDPNQKTLGIRSKTYGTKPLPHPKAVRRALVFAAKMLARQSSTELLIEKMQWHEQWPDAINQLIGCLIGGLIGGLTGGLVGGLIGSSIGWMMAEPVEDVYIWMSESNKVRRQILSLVPGQIGKLLFVLLFALLFVLLFALLRLIGLPREPTTNSLSVLLDGLTWLPDWLTELIGWLTGLIGWLENWLFLLGFLMLFMCYFPLINGVIITLIFGLEVDIQTHIEPNQGIKNSMKNMVIVTAISIVMALPLKFLLEYLLPNVVDSKVLSRFVSFSIAMSIWISFQQSGGNALIKHLVLRFVLAWNRYVPLRYDLLLNYCTERLLLQRIGGRYRFIHKLLQDHFAKMGLE